MTPLGRFLFTPMNISTNIQQWLDNSGSFAEGLKLHAQIGEVRSHQSLRKYLTFPMIPSAAADTLRHELRAYLIQHPAPLQGNTGSQPAPKKAPAPETPAELVPLYAKAKALLKERDAHRAQLVQMAVDEEKYTHNDRYMLAEAIMTVQGEIDETYQRIERYHAEGQLPAAGSTQNIYREAVEKYQRILSIRSAISRLNKRLQKPANDQKKQEDENELLAKQVELEDLLEELGLQD
jgi:hypothetical protein